MCPKPLGGEVVTQELRPDGERATGRDRGIGRVDQGLKQGGRERFEFERNGHRTPSW